MKKKYLFIIGFLCVLTVILLPEAQHLLSLDIHSPMATVLATGPCIRSTQMECRTKQYGRL